VIPLDTVAEVAIGTRASKRCRKILANVAAGHADLILIRDVSRLSESPEQLHEIITEHQHRIAISRDDADHF
jgi:DNA invertase Pin-like site-specific DNA recombinase